MITYDEGKVYLRDVRNGTIYPYERFLAADRNFEAYIPNPVKSAVAEHTPTTAHGNGQSVEEFNQELAANTPLPHQL